MVALAQAANRVGKLGGAPSIELPIMRICIALTICIALVLVIALRIKRRSGRFDLSTLFVPLSKPRQELRVVEVRRINLHSDVALIEHCNRRYLILVQAGQSTVLSEEMIATDEVSECLVAA